MTGVVRDAKDYEEYGGNLPPRPASVVGATQHSIKSPVSEKEQRAGCYDFNSTKSKWVNKDLTQTPEYKALPEGFKRTLGTIKVYSLH